MAQVIITDKGMQARPGAKDNWLIESGARGAGRLVGRITPAGERRFYFRYTDSRGVQVRQLIGHFDAKGDGASAYTVGQARQRADEWSLIYRNGVKDLREHFAQQEVDRRNAEDSARQAAEAARVAADEAARAAEMAAARRITVRRLFEQWQRVELTPLTLADGTRTGRKDGGQWVLDSFERRLFPKLGEIAAEDVRKADLLAILDECKADGRRRTANVLLADMRQMFRFAAEREIVLRNPLEGIKRANVGGKDVERDRTLTDDEIKKLWAAMPTANLGARSAAAIWLILSTACRVGEAMGARWEHVNLERKTWFLPETKNQRDHLIHLSDFAANQIAVLAGLREVNAAGAPIPWIFPNSAGSGPVDIKSFGKQLADRQRPPERKLRNRAKNTIALALPGGRWTAHDLRRTAATIMARLGVSTDVIDECLNHKLQSKVARVYIKDRRLAEQARAFDALGLQISKLIDAR